MTTGFGVDLAALSGVAQGITRVVAQFDSTAADPTALDGQAVGHDSLTSALSTFHSRWQQGMHHMTTDGQQFADNLSRTSASYAQVEDGIAQALQHAEVP